MSEAIRFSVEINSNCDNQTKLIIAMQDIIRAFYNFYDVDQNEVCMAVNYVNEACKLRLNKQSKG